MKFGTMRSITAPVTRRKLLAMSASRPDGIRDGLRLFAVDCGQTGARYVKTLNEIKKLREAVPAG